MIRLRLRIPLDLLAELEDFCARNLMPRPFLVEKNDKSALVVVFLEKDNHLALICKFFSGSKAYFKEDKLIIERLKKQNIEKTQK